jgi:SAM-dependent methyltransferase
MKRISKMPRSPRAFWKRIVKELKARGESYEQRLYSHALNRQRFAEVVRICEQLAEDQSIARVVELGCAEGYLTVRLTDLFPMVWGVDFCEEFIVDAAKRAPKALFVCADVEKWQPSCEFDLIVATEMIEHLKDMRGELERWREFGHRLLVSAPIAEGEPNDRSFDAGLFLREERVADASGHVWFFDGLDDLVTVLTDAGWSVVQAQEVGRSGVVLCE